MERNTEKKNHQTGKKKRKEKSQHDIYMVYKYIYIMMLFVTSCVLCFLGNDVRIN